MSMHTTKSDLKKIYNPFNDDVDTELFKTALEQATSYDCMMGYFTSNSLGVLAGSLLAYLNSDITNKMRFIISPNLSKQDLQTLFNYYQNPEEFKKDIQSFDLSESNLRNNTLIALLYLFSNKRIELKIAIPKSGLFHIKCWLLKQKNGSEISIYGSSNHTAGGLTRNFEYLFVSHNEDEDEPLDSVSNRLRNDFNTLWSNNYEGVVCGSLSPEIIEILLNEYNHLDKDRQKRANIIDSLLQSLSVIEESDSMNEDDFKNIEDLLSSKEPNQLVIPSWLKYREGDYAHQGQAIDAWFENGSKGILSIATGGGKTLTSLAAATLLTQKTDSLMIIVAVPTVALMNQWYEEISLFGVQAVNTNSLNKRQKLSSIRDACREIKFGISKNSVIIVTHDFLKSDVMSDAHKYLQDVQTLLIADEVHNLGSIGFIKNAPTFFDYKIGLSATPVRQYDDEGTEFLLKYFNNVVFDFPLSEAIGKCLVEFDYFVKLVHLNAEEEDDFYEITQKIKRLSYAASYSKESEEFKALSSLWIQRRRIIETANNKLKAFAETFPDDKNQAKNSLIFCSDKEPEQLNAINDILNHRNINFHQITSKETANPRLLKSIIEEYNLGNLHVLTSKRVLDEGFNVPQTKTAYVLASNTTRKQWTQRLGRVLRKANNKEYAVIYDYVVLPMNLDSGFDPEFNSLIKGELERIMFFLEYARNGTEQGGAVEVLEKVVNIINK